MNSRTNWLLIFAGCALLGIAIGYFLTLLLRPQLLPPSLRLGIGGATTVLLLGVDVVYTGNGSHLQADQTSFQGRSDTVMLARFDPARNEFSVLSIPRDTSALIPGNGRQKINGANAIGGERLAMRTVENLTGIHCDHFVVLNVHGLVELVDALGGITINIPKRMRYHDKAAKLNINLDAGSFTLNGTDAMGFVRFRHDALGDIGRVQRQQLFMQAVLDKALSPASWVKVPELLQIAQRHVKTDMDIAQLMKLLTFIRQVPKNNQHMVMLPGNFSGTGDWNPDEYAMKRVFATMLGKPLPAVAKSELKISIENASSNSGLGRKVSRYLGSLGYAIVSTTPKSEVFSSPQSISKIIAERGNPQEAALLNADLQNHAEVVNASIGDIHSSLTLISGDDLIPLVESATDNDKNRQRNHQ